MKWQPIKTIPLNKHVLVYTDYGIVEVYFDGTDFNICRAVYVEHGYEYEADCEAYPRIYIYERPTFWMPLPPPPECEECKHILENSRFTHSCECTENTKCDQCHVNSPHCETCGTNHLVHNCEIYYSHKE